MMNCRNYYCFLLLVAVFFSLTSCDTKAQSRSINSLWTPKDTTTEAFVKKEYHYDIVKLKMKAGETVLSFNGMTKYQDRDVFSISFQASAFKFLDEETIYMDPESYKPVYIERNLNLWGNTERIKEHYAVDGKVTVIKTAKGKTTEQILEKDRPLDNVYCFLYRYQTEGRLQIGEELRLNLPTKDVIITVIEQTELKIADKTYDAFRLESNLKDYRFWFENSPEKTPLRIDGPFGIGKVSMLLRESM